MTETQTTIAPHTQQPLVSRVYPTEKDLDAVIKAASEAQKTWSKVPLKQRIAIGYKFIVSMHPSTPGAHTHGNKGRTQIHGERVSSGVDTSDGQVSSFVSKYSNKACVIRQSD